MCKLTLITGLCVIIASLGLPGLAHGSPCDGRPNGDYPNPKDPHTYYSCVAGITYTRPCPAGLVYSPTKKYCDYPAQTTSPLTSAQTTSTTTPAQTTGTPNGNYCDGRANGDYPNPNDLHTYYSCVAGITYTRPCPSGLVYSPSKQVCDYPGQSTSPPTPAQTTSPSTSAQTTSPSTPAQTTGTRNGNCKSCKCCKCNKKCATTPTATTTTQPTIIP